VNDKNNAPHANRYMISTKVPGGWLARLSYATLEEAFEYGKLHDVDEYKITDNYRKDREV
jgi:hypothetical protein